MTEELYPKLPSAPDNPHFSNDGTLNTILMRRRRINEIYKELNLLKEKRYNTYKKYSKAYSGLNNTAIALGTLATIESIAGITTSLTVIGLPVGIVLTSIGAFSGATSALLATMAKHYEKKRFKHMKIYNTIDTRITVLDKAISRIIDDNIITNEEYNSVLDGYTNIKNILIDKVDVNKLREELKKELKSKL